MAKRKKRVYWKWIILIIIVIWIIRNLGGELYRISSGQMEGTLLPGDNIMVGKWNYGLRLPVTPFSIPFLHDSITVFNSRSYLSSVRLPYFRLFDKEASRNDIVVFNRPDPIDETTPIDRRKIAVGRCIGLPGDTISMQEGRLFINGKESAQPPLTMEAYLTPDSLESELSALLKHNEISDPGYQQLKGNRLRFFTKMQYYILHNSAKNKNILNPVHLKRNNFTIILPRPGQPVQITPDNIKFLYPLLMLHEGRQIIKKENRLYEKGREVTWFRFSQPYYWMMGDNRENAIDSRTFGAVPQSHLIGKAKRIWFSTNPDKPFYESLRPTRTFKPVSKN